MDRREGWYTRDELRKMKSIKIITIYSCWPCHLWVHGNGVCYHTEGLKDRLKEEGNVSQNSDSDAERSGVEEVKNTRLRDRNRGRKKKPNSNRFLNFFTRNGLPASISRAQAFRDAVGHNTVCPFCASDTSKDRVRYKSLLGLTQHILKAHGAEIAEKYLAKLSAAESASSAEDVSVDNDDFEDLRPPAKKAKATNCTFAGCKRQFPSARAMKVHYGKMHSTKKTKTKHRYKDHSTKKKKGKHRGKKKRRKPDFRLDTTDSESD